MIFVSKFFCRSFSLYKRNVVVTGKFILYNFTALVRDAGEHGHEMTGAFPLDLSKVVQRRVLVAFYNGIIGNFMVCQE